MKFSENDFFVGMESKGLYCPDIYGDKYIRFTITHNGRIDAIWYNGTEKDILRRYYVARYKFYKEDIDVSLQKIQKIWGWVSEYREDYEKDFHRPISCVTYTMWGNLIKENPTTSPIRLFLEILPKNAYKGRKEMIYANQERRS